MAHEPEPAALDELRALAVAPNPDQRLLLTCDKWTLLCEERDRLYRKQAKGYMVRVREMMRETDALEAEIANTPARTAAGRRAKAEAAMYMLGMTGRIAQMARSALHDFMNCGGEGGAFYDRTGRT